MDFWQEKKLKRKGYSHIIGLDEAGRGALAGPVMTAGVMTLPYFRLKPELESINDSKKISAGQREKFYRLLLQEDKILWFNYAVSEKYIDRYNILEATKCGMEKIVQEKADKVDFVLIDGNFNLSIETPQRAVVKGDETVFSIAAASIVAKVTRDRLMKRYHQQFPVYGFDQHKGYATQYHLEMIRKHGPSKIHRKTFQGVGKR